ncbi:MULTISPECIES: response regulator transcription factor [unclassified Leptolyngbya]|uniref:response regulator transcription factor n=1 Tax=unclassified Leptolyngbya TaxID=2650499 RepID=UPI001688B558|nr:MULTISPECIES: response regulator transcription factor [unclassified Leptolyngbya]MBD1909313.1 response regulator transcription factor [Leptolyngbya sp. FACHB-8]MBD2153543.1 response regulator transcription factor [Leptolyngbya sp. FACHB-16]
MSQTDFLPPTILLVEPDNRVRPLLRDNLSHWGYSLIVALDEADALERTHNGRENFDLLLLAQWDQSLDYFVDLGRRICQQVNPSGFIPIVIMAEQFGAELEGQNIQVGTNEYIVYLEDGQQLKDFLYRICPI